MCGGFGRSQRPLCRLPHLLSGALRKDPDRIEIAPQPNIGADSSAGLAKVHCVVEFQHVCAGEETKTARSYPVDEG